jgi:hypothetical protein
VVKEIRLFVEGGGADEHTQIKLRRGLSMFFQPLVQKARDRKIRWRLIAGGSNQETFKRFNRACKQAQGEFLMLLVDSDGPLPEGAAIWTYLNKTFGWSAPDLTDDHAHLFVQAMEAWLVSDPEALRAYYGPDFNAKPIPNTNEPEKIPKDRLVPALEQATRSTSKGKYHKIQHAGDLLARLNPDIVRQNAASCNRLWTTIEQLIDPARKPI